MTFGRDGSQPIRVLISDTSPLVAAGIDAALAASPSFEVRRGTLDRLMQGEIDGPHPVDVVVIDREPGMRLAEAGRLGRLPARLQQSRIFAFHQSPGERDIRAALEAGIHGVATIELTLDEFLEGIRTVSRGMRYVCPRTARCLADSVTREALTRRESDVLRKLALGCCNKTIAHELDMALGTVKAHVKALMSKLDARTRTQVVSVAIARGLVDPGIQAARPATETGRVGGPTRPAAVTLLLAA